MKAASKMTITASGDSFITRRLAPKDQRAKEIKEWMSNADVRFTNLETTTHERKGYPARFSGGTWALSEPHVLDDLQYYGFNLMNWATNHTLDYSVGGLQATEEELNKRHIVHAGAGENLASASEPRYLDTPSGRVAIVAATTTFQPDWLASDPTPHISGRPGVNALRHEEIFYITEPQMRSLKDMAAETLINAENELLIQEGFEKKSEEEIYEFGGKKFKISTQAGRARKLVTVDIQRLTISIEEAKKQADYVIVSLHSHEMSGIDKNKPADFLIEAAHACIEAGADVIFGHGPHVVRGIEIYQQKPIFYSLGNFIFQNETVKYLPSDFFEKHNINGFNVPHAFDIRSNFGEKGLGANPEVWESIIAKLKWGEEGMEEIELKPIDLGYGTPRYTRGWPVMTENSNVLERLQNLSRQFGTELTIENSIGYIRF